MKSTYSLPAYDISYDIGVGEKFQPIVYDLYDYGKNPSPEVFFRVMKKDLKTCIQYYYYWEEQTCKDDYRISGRGSRSLFIGYMTGNFVAIIGLPIYILAGFFSSFLIFLLLFVGSFILGFTIGSLLSFLGWRMFERLIGGFFTHKHDYEPIFVFLNENEAIEKIVYSGMGDVQEIPHRTDIYSDQNRGSREGSCIFFTSKKPYFPFGEQKEEAFFYEDDLGNMGFEGIRPKLGISTCYHAFSTKGDYLKKEPMDIPLRKLTDDVMDTWFEKGHFGHDPSDPFDFPYIKFHKPPGLEQTIDRRKILKFLGCIGNFKDCMGGFLEQSIHQRLVDKK